ncbi:MAG: prohibitin family protein [Candidatus Omnitrophica bacterium]|nr:prohibitin family protein [Candidatus Omnitrophota bacterium]
MFMIAVALLVAALIMIISRDKFRNEKEGYDYSGTVRNFIIGGIIFAGVIGFFSLVRTVPAGHVGVVDLWGNVEEQVRKPGINLVNPFVNLVLMDVQTQELKETMQVPSKEGLTMDVEISILYRLSPDKASNIYKTIGRDYDEVVVVPQFRSAVREATVFYEAKALYTSSRDEITNKIFADLEKMLSERGVILEKVLLRAVQLPGTVSQAIEQKLKAEQESEQMKFVLTKESQEAQRKVIEAKGIAEAQGIINKTLTQAYLQHEAIKAQMMMANSSNHTTVYIPSGDNGIPLVRTVNTESNQTSK